LIQSTPRQKNFVTVPHNSLCIIAAKLFFIRVSRTRSFLKYWLVPLAWMSLIFFGSADSQSYTHSSRLIEPFLHWLFPHMSQAHVELIHHVIRKCCHLTEYAILGALLWRAVRKPVRPDSRPWSWREAMIAILIVFLYASTDEFHQMFVPTRTPMVSDVFIDTSGAIIGMIILFTLGRFFHWWPKAKKNSNDDALTGRPSKAQKSS
jgi:VanZ family protein